MLLKKSLLKFLGDMLRLKTKQSELIIHHVTKTLRKAIMKSTQQQHRYFKTVSSKNLKLFKRQRCFCSILYKRRKKKYFSNLDLNKITDNKLFWKTVMALLSDKGVNTTNISLVN